MDKGLGGTGGRLVEKCVWVRERAREEKDSEGVEDDMG